MCEQVCDKVEERGNGWRIVPHGIFGFLLHFLAKNMDVLDNLRALFLDRARELSDILEYDDDVDENYYRYYRNQRDCDGGDEEEYVSVDEALHGFILA